MTAEAAELLAENEELPSNYLADSFEIVSVEEELNS